MTTSQPSKLIYIVDVPEVRNFAGNFHYNFFVIDEYTNDQSNLPKSITERPASETDVTYESAVKLKTPRYIKFDWLNSSTVKNVGTKQVSAVRKNLIKNNFNKILSEDVFSTFNYTSVLFSDSDIDKKIYNTVSSSLDLLNLDFSINRDTTNAKLADQLNSLLEGSISHNDIVTSVLTFQDSLDYSKFGKVSKNSGLEELKKFNIHTQFNTALLNDIIASTIRNPLSQHSNSLYEILDKSQQLRQINTHAANVSDEDFETRIPVLLTLEQPQIATSIPSTAPAEIIGFIIEKYEIADDGTLIEHSPIIIENALFSSAYDFQIKYGKSYQYAIKSIALYTLPAFNESTLQPTVINFLVSSKLSGKHVIRCTEDNAPPAPSNVSFAWNYNEEKLQINWDFPTNSQRDIKKFQVFRRKSVDFPFELLKEYDFNDASTQFQFETPAKQLVQKTSFPIRFFIDDDFTKNSKFIYAICAIDAHGLTSCYSAQFEVSFDVFKNRLIQKLISHSGAPKPYPNLYFEADTFVDTILIGNSDVKQAKIYFSPECFEIKNDDKQIQTIVSTAQKNGKYRLSFINLDNQTPATVDVTIDDRANSIETNQQKKQV